MIAREREPLLYRRYGKRLVDLALTVPALLVLAPVLAMVALAVRLKLGSPVLFCQARPGQHGTPFRLFKFRTMTDARDSEGQLLPNEARITRFGTLLRSLSLDELPELWNVLRGEMSLVGPRPLLVEYLPLYTTEQARRHDVKPGLTGWAQINGRNSISWEEKFERDIWYVDNLSLRLDLYIIWRTVASVLSRRDIRPEGQVTMPRFTGTKTAQEEHVNDR